MILRADFLLNIDQEVLGFCFFIVTGQGKDPLDLA